MSNIKPILIEYKEPFYLYKVCPVEKTIRCSDNVFFRDTYDNSCWLHKITLAKYMFNDDGSKKDTPEYEPNHYLVEPIENINWETDNVRTHPIEDWDKLYHVGVSNEEFIKDFLASPYAKKFLFDQYRIVAVFLTGSRGLNLQGTQSDFDLKVITLDDVPLEPKLWTDKTRQDYCLSYKGKKVHWYIHNVYNYSWDSYNLVKVPWDYYNSFIQIYALDKSKFLYYDPKYQLQLEQFFRVLRKYVYIGFFGFINHEDLAFDKILEHIEQDGIIPRAKGVYHLINWALFVQNKKLTDYLEEVVAIKSSTIMANPMPNKKICDWAATQLYFLKDYITKNSIDLEAEISKLLTELKMITW